MKRKIKNCKNCINKRKKTNIRQGSRLLLSRDVARVQSNAVAVVVERNRLAAAELATVFVGPQRGDGHNMGHRALFAANLHHAVLHEVLELTSASAQADTAEERQAKSTEAIATDHGVGQGHAVRLTSIVGQAAFGVEPLSGGVRQRARREAVRKGLLRRNVAGQGRAEVGKPVAQELDQGHLVAALQTGQGHVDVELVRTRGETASLGLLTAKRVLRHIQSPVTGKRRQSRKNAIIATVC